MMNGKEWRIYDGIADGQQVPTDTLEAMLDAYAAYCVAESTKSQDTDSQTYDTPCAVCSKPLDGHTHELSAGRVAEIDAWLNSMSGVPAKLPVLATPMSNALQVCYDLRQHITALQSRLQAAEKRIKDLEGE